MVSLVLLAAIGGLSAMGATAVASGDATTAANAAHLVPPGLKIALAHVPSWTHAHQVLAQRLSGYAQNGSMGAGGAAGAGTAAKKALARGIGRTS